jgi:tRNA (guanine-N7-)-methyltransferase
MQRYAQLLQPNGLIHLKTDSPFLYTYTQAMVKENKYPLLVDTDDLYGDRAIGQESDEARALQTHYEHQWLDRGLTIKYLRWELNHAEDLIEPDIEIEKDSYRSYGRNYVSTTNN